MDIVNKPWKIKTTVTYRKTYLILLASQIKM